jgi:hypothetical protein
MRPASRRARKARRFRLRSDRREAAGVGLQNGQRLMSFISGTAGRVIGVLLLLAAGVEFVVRGPLRAVESSGDLACPFAGNRDER